MPGTTVYVSSNIYVKTETYPTMETLCSCAPTGHHKLS